jgi:hypothetical protein
MGLNNSKTLPMFLQLAELSVLIDLELTLVGQATYQRLSTVPKCMPILREMYGELGCKEDNIHGFILSPPNVPAIQIAKPLWELARLAYQVELTRLLHPTTGGHIPMSPYDLENNPYKGFFFAAYDSEGVFLELLKNRNELLVSAY